MQKNQKQRKNARIWILLIGALCAGLSVLPAAAEEPAAAVEPASAAAPAAAAALEPAAAPSNAAATATAAAPAAEQPAADPAEVIVTVNEQKVTRGDYTRETEEIALMLKTRGVPESQFEAMIKNFKPQIVDGLVTRALINQACADKKITVSDEDLAAKIAAFEKNLPKNLTLAGVLKQSGLTREMFENDMREQLKLEKLLQIGQATEEQVIAYYEENKARFFEKPEMTHARHILIAVKPNDTDEQKKEKRARAEQLLKQLKEEQVDFAKLAEENSDCPSKAMGGDLGEFWRGQMDEKFADAAFGMQTNEISGVVETRYGYHIIQTLGHTEPKTLELNEVRERIVEALKGRAIQEKAESFMDEMRKQAQITYAKDFDPAQKTETEQPAGEPRAEPGAAAPDASKPAADAAASAPAGTAEPKTAPADAPAKTAEPPAEPADAPAKTAEPTAAPAN